MRSTVGQTDGQSDRGADGARGKSICFLTLTGGGGGGGGGWGDMKNIASMFCNSSATLKQSIFFDSVRKRQAVNFLLHDSISQKSQASEKFCSIFPQKDHFSLK